MPITGFMRWSTPYTTGDRGRHLFCQQTPSKRLFCVSHLLLLCLCLVSLSLSAAPISRFSLGTLFCAWRQKKRNRRTPFCLGAWALSPEQTNGNKKGEPTTAGNTEYNDEWHIPRNRPGNRPGSDSTVEKQCETGALPTVYCPMSIAGQQTEDSRDTKVGQKNNKGQETNRIPKQALPISWQFLCPLLVKFLLRGASCVYASPCTRSARRRLLRSREPPFDVLRTPGTDDLSP